jgi:hypothetical protein
MSILSSASGPHTGGGGGGRVVSSTQAVWPAFAMPPLAHGMQIRPRLNCCGRAHIVHCVRSALTSEPGLHIWQRPPSGLNQACAPLPWHGWQAVWSAFGSLPGAQVSHVCPIGLYLLPSQLRHVWLPMRIGSIPATHWKVQVPWYVQTFGAAQMPLLHWHFAQSPVVPRCSTVSSTHDCPVSGQLACTLGHVSNICCVPDVPAFNCPAGMIQSAITRLYCTILLWQSQQSSMHRLIRPILSSLQSLEPGGGGGMTGTEYVNVICR